MPKKPLPSRKKPRPPGRLDIHVVGCEELIIDGRPVKLCSDDFSYETERSVVPVSIRGKIWHLPVSDPEENEKFIYSNGEFHLGNWKLPSQPLETKSNRKVWFWVALIVIAIVLLVWFLWMVKGKDRRQ